MNGPLCHACAFGLDDSDNFCRQCGSAVGATSLPTLRRSTSLTIWRPQLSPVVKGAAVMAAGTVGQFMLRRVVGTLLGDDRSGTRRGIRVRTPRDRDNLVDEAQIVTETVMMRRVRIRRQA